MSLVKRRLMNPLRHKIRNDSSYLFLGLLGILLAFAIAYLVVAGLWPIALVLIFALPGFILIHRYPFVAVIIWLMLDPFLVATDGGLFRNVYWVIHRALPLVTLGIVVLSYSLKVKRRNLPRLGLVELSMVGYIGATVLSVFYQSDQVQFTTFFLYDHIVVPISLYFIVRLTNPSEQVLRRILPVLLFIILSQSIIGLLSWTVPQVLPLSWLGRVGTRTTGSLDSYSVFSATMIFCALLVLQSVLNHTYTKIVRLGLYASFFLALFMVFFTFSRGSWLGALLVLSGVTFLYPKFISRFGFVVLVVIVLVIGSGLLSPYIQYAQNRTYSDSSEESALARLPVVLGSIRMFESKPLFGWGYENFDKYDYQFQERVGELVSPEKDHASHNLYLTILAEQGLVGFLLYLTPVFILLMKTIKALPKMPSQGYWSKKLLIFFWLVVVFHITVNNFSNMRVVFGLGMWWITLGFIASMVDDATRLTQPIVENPNGYIQRLLENNSSLIVE